MPRKPARRLRVFLCHSSHDKPTVRELYRRLSAEGWIDPWLDEDKLLPGQDWDYEIEKALDDSDAVIVTLSTSSVSKEGYIQKELKFVLDIALEKPEGTIFILPVRLDDCERPRRLRPIQGIDYFPSERQEMAYDRILQSLELRAKALGKLSRNRPKRRSLRQLLTRPGDESGAKLSMPLGGALLAGDKFYVERRVDSQLRNSLISQRSDTILLYGPNQSGKSSMIIRGLGIARQTGSNIAYIDLQSFGSDAFHSPKTFARALIDQIIHQLHRDSSKIKLDWDDNLTWTMNLSRVMSRNILNNLSNSTVIAIDEADCLQGTGFASDFFGLIRSWHNQRATSPEWSRVTFLIAMRIKPFLIISSDTLQSPFNVGKVLYLDDFDEEQVRALNHLYGNPLPEEGVTSLMSLLAGHPYLTSLALRTLSSTEINLADFWSLAPSNEGPFAGHLEYLYHFLLSDAYLFDLFKGIMVSPRSSTTETQEGYLILEGVGLIKEIRFDSVYQCRCELYQLFFRRKIVFDTSK
jgi:hypothetical protein